MTNACFSQITVLYPTAIDSMYGLQDVEEAFDFRFQFPFSAVISGPSGSGKTVFVKNLLCNANKMIDVKIDNIVFLYCDKGNLIVTAGEAALAHTHAYTHIPHSLSTFIPSRCFCCRRSGCTRDPTAYGQVEYFSPFPSVYAFLGMSRIHTALCMRFRLCYVFVCVSVC